MFRTVFALVLLVACRADNAPNRFQLAGSEAAQYATAYIAEVVPSTDGGDLQVGGGEHVVVNNNWDYRADLGGWSIVDADGNRLLLGTGRQLDAGKTLRVYTSCGGNTDEAVFSCADGEVLDDEGDLLRLLDSAGNEVARFAYGSAAEDDR